MKLLAIESVAEKLDVSRQTIQRLIESGVLPAVLVRSGRRKKLWRVRPECLDQWILQKEQEAARSAKRKL